MTDTATTTQPRKAAALFILFTVLLDMLSFGIVIPVLPKLVEEFLSGDTARAAEGWDKSGRRGTERVCPWWHSRLS